MQIKVKQLNGTSVTIELSLDSDVKELKDAVNETTNIESSDQRLIYAGQELEDDKTLRFYNYQKEGCIHLIEKHRTLSKEDAPASDASAEERPVDASFLKIGEESMESEEVENLEEGENVETTEQKKEEEEEENVQFKVQESNADAPSLEEASDAPSEPEDQAEAKPQFDQMEEVVFKYKTPFVVKICFNGMFLMVDETQQIVTTDEPAQTSLFHLHYKPHNEKFGFEHTKDSKFLFSAPPFQGVFHFPYGGNQVFALYRQFSHGEEFLMNNEGMMQCFRNGYYWVVKKGIVEITKNPKEASVFRVVDVKSGDDVRGFLH